MSRRVNYYRLHIGDYLRDTAHLSLLEHGVYTRLLQVYYSREAPIADAEKYRLVGARSEDERAAVDAVLGEFFTRSGEGWVQARCDREIAEYQVKAERNREIGRLGGRPVKASNPQETQTVSAPNPDETLASSQEPIAKRKDRERAASAAPSPRGSRIPDGFPDADALAWAGGERPDLDVRLTAEKFRDYWRGVPGTRGSKADWPATWRNFVRSERGAVRARASPNAADRRDAFIASLTGRPANPDPRIIDVDAFEPTTPRLSLGGR